MSGYKELTQKVIAGGLGLLFLWIAFTLWGTEVKSNVVIAMIMLFGVAILIAEIGWKAFTDGNITFVEIVTGVIVLFTSIYAMVILVGSTLDPTGLIAQLVPWIMIVLAIDIVIQGFR